MCILENEALFVEIADKGAELCRVYDKEAGIERIWNADPSVWNRHAPLLFPFVGKVNGGKYRLNGREYEMKTQHGFARDLEFVCVEESRNSVSYILTASDATLAIYPFEFQLKVRHYLDGNDPRLLHIEWTVSNTGTDTMYYSIGGHPAFLPPEGMKKEDCFLGFPGRKELQYISVDPAGFAVPDVLHRLEPENFLVPYGSSLPNTWIFEGHQVSKVQIVRPDKTPFVTVCCEEFPILAVWSNAAGPFICLEPWFGRTDNEGFAGEISEKAFEQQLGPGMSRRITWSILFH